jgi:hypothetical protein
MLGRTNAIIPIASAADLSGKEGYGVTAAGAITGANAAVFGIVAEGYAVGMTSSVAVCAGGEVVKVKLGANAVVGDMVGSLADGTMSPAATVKCAVIIEAGSTDELVQAVTFRAV